MQLECHVVEIDLGPECLQRLSETAKVATTGK